MKPITDLSEYRSAKEKRNSSLAQLKKISEQELTSEELSLLLEACGKIAKDFPDQIIFETEILAKYNQTKEARTAFVEEQSIQLLSGKNINPLLRLLFINMSHTVINLHNLYGYSQQIIYFWLLYSSLLFLKREMTKQKAFM